MESASPPLIGDNIQVIRKEQKLTLSKLADKSGVSKAMLSQIESDKVNPTVATVWKIARGLNVDINNLLRGTGEPARKFDVSRSQLITSLNTHEKGLHIKVLSPISMAEDLEIYMLVFEPKGSIHSAPHFLKTEEYLTVIEGHVMVKAGENQTELHTGDFISYHCDVAHSIENLSASDAKIHMIVKFHG